MWFYGSEDIAKNIFGIFKASAIQKCFDLKFILNQTKVIIILKKFKKKFNFIAHINFNESMILNEDVFKKSFYTPFDLSNRAEKEYVNN